MEIRTPPLNWNGISKSWCYLIVMLYKIESSVSLHRKIIVSTNSKRRHVNLNCIWNLIPNFAASCCSTVAGRFNIFSLHQEPHWTVNVGTSNTQSLVLQRGSRSISTLLVQSFFLSNWIGRTRGSRQKGFLASTRMDTLGGFAIAVKRRYKRVCCCSVVSVCRISHRVVVRWRKEDLILWAGLLVWSSIVLCKRLQTRSSALKENHQHDCQTFYLTHQHTQSNVYMQQVVVDSRS